MERPYTISGKYLTQFLGNTSYKNTWKLIGLQLAKEVNFQRVKVKSVMLSGVEKECIGKNGLHHSYKNLSGNINISITN